MTKQKERNEEKFSLLHPMAMGGIHGGDGYTFQERYIVCSIPHWLSDPEFIRFMSEATGDVDVVYRKETTFLYDHIQVKDHEVTLSEFKKVIRNFVQINSGTINVYRNFILTAKGLNGQLRPLVTALNRYREVEKLYDASSMNPLETTLNALHKKITNLGLAPYKEFLIQKVEVETGKFDLSDNGTCKRMFVSGLLEHDQYKKHLFDIILPVYSVMIQEVMAHRGKVFESEQIHNLIAVALANRSEISNANVLHLHNWTSEKFEPKSTINLDWSSKFDRLFRKVPDADVWNTELIPTLYEKRQDILSSTTNRHIVFRGKCTLSTGIALGAAFPETGNWTFELIQPPLTSSWRSDAERDNKYKIKHEVIDPASVGLDEEGDEIAIVFNITGIAIDEVVNYFKKNQVTVKKIILVQPNKKPGNSSIQSDSEAVTLASLSKDILKQMQTKYKSKKTHLFYFGPFGLSVFLGQKLTSVGQIQLYEFQDPGYKPTCLIKT